MKKTILYDQHLACRARMVDYSGWAMPLQYSGIVAEHLATRRSAGLFDVSHMGELRVSGHAAGTFLDYTLSRPVSSLAEGRVAYAMIMNHAGGVVDDVLVYRLQATVFLLVVNAANTAAAADWLRSCLQAGPADCRLDDVSEHYAQLAVQGPAATEIVSGWLNQSLDQLRPFRFQLKSSGSQSEQLISRTGYTGEDGYEIYLHPNDAVSAWKQLLEIGRPLGLKPAGLGARDSLRLEAALPLYGHELAADITPLESGLASFVQLDRPDFIGRDALLVKSQDPSRRQLVGLVAEGRALPRQHCRVRAQGRIIGEVTSGGYAPYLERSIALARVDPAAGAAEPGQPAEIEIRGKWQPARITELPFYRWNRSRKDQ